METDSNGNNNNNKPQTTKTTTIMGIMNWNKMKQNKTNEKLTTSADLLARASRKNQAHFLKVFSSTPAIFEARLVSVS